MSPVKVTYYCLPLSSHLPHSSDFNIWNTEIFASFCLNFRSPFKGTGGCVQPFMFSHTDTEQGWFGIKNLFLCPQMYLTTKLFQPSDLLAQERTVNHHTDMLGPGPNLLLENDVWNVQILLLLLFTWSCSLIIFSSEQKGVKKITKIREIMLT